MVSEYKRGQVYLAELEKNGSVQGGLRPVVIVQNNVGNRFSPTVIVCTMTTKIKKKNMPTHVNVNETDGVKMSTDIQTEQILTINKSQLSEFYLCELDEKAMKAVDKALMISLGIEQKEAKTAIETLKDIIHNRTFKMSTMNNILDLLENNVC